ncbi:hypothetical protein Q2330_26415, partial [Escherichia coli]|nr:hypothetical protein [Escherichia coli]
QHFNKAVRFAQQIIFVSCHDEIHHLLVLFTNLPYLSRQVKLVIFKYFNELKSWHAKCIRTAAGHCPISEQ